MSNIGHHPWLTQIHPPLPRPPIPGKQPQPSFGSAKRRANVGHDVKRWRETHEGFPFVNLPLSLWLLRGRVSSWASRSQRACPWGLPPDVTLAIETLWGHSRPFSLTARTVQLRSAWLFLPPKLQPQEPNGFQVFANLKYVISVFYFLGPLESEPPISIYPLL